MGKNSESYRPQLSYFFFLSFLFLAAIILQPEPSDTPTDFSTEGVIGAPKLPQNIPDFSSMVNIAEKKASFFDFLSPYVEIVNQNILIQRQRLIRFREKIISGSMLNRNEMNYLSSLRVEYKLENEVLNTLNLIDRLLRRVDIIPNSLALAQAANESAWGTSRFAREGNNFFGQWCFTNGCGMIPSRRLIGANHEVRRFNSVFDSVESYIMNLNTFPSYQKLRDLRLEVRQGGRTIDGISLSEGLGTYSSRGVEYIVELQSMIYSNNLLKLDLNGA